MRTAFRYTCIWRRGLRARPSSQTAACAIPPTGLALLSSPPFSTTRSAGVSPDKPAPHSPAVPLRLSAPAIPSKRSNQKSGIASRSLFSSPAQWPPRADWPAIPRPRRRRDRTPPGRQSVRSSRSGGFIVASRFRVLLAAFLPFPELVRNPPARDIQEPAFEGARAPGRISAGRFFSRP